MCRGFFSATVFFLSLGFWHFCCQADIREILYSGMLALFIQNLSSNVYNFVFYSIFRNISIVGQFFLSVFLMVLIYGIFYFQIIRRFARERLENMLSNVAWIWLIAVGIFVFFLALFILDLWNPGGMGGISTSDSVRYSGAWCCPWIRRVAYQKCRQ